MAILDKKLNKQGTASAAPASSISGRNKTDENVLNKYIEAAGNTQKSGVLGGYLPQQKSDGVLGGYLPQQKTTAPVTQESTVPSWERQLLADDMDFSPWINTTKGKEGSVANVGEGLEYTARSGWGGLLGGLKNVANAASYETQFQGNLMRANRDYFENAEGDPYRFMENIDEGTQFANAMADQSMRQGKGEADAIMDNAVYTQASNLGDEFNRETQEKYGNTTGGWKVAADLAQTIGQQVPAIALNAVPVVGQAASSAYFFGSAMGGGIDEALQDGADMRTALDYGQASGLVEMATEKVFDGMAGLVGAGAMDDVTEALIAKLAKTNATRNMLRILVGSMGEGAEEVMSDLANPIIKTIYNGKSVGENFKELSIRDMAYDYLLGALSGGVMGSVGTVNGEFRNKNNIINSYTVQSALEEFNKTETGKRFKSIIDAVSKENTSREDLTELARKINEEGKGNITPQELIQAREDLLKAGADKQTAMDTAQEMAEVTRSSREEELRQIVKKSMGAVDEAEMAEITKEAKGKVIYEGVDEKTLNSRQKATVNMAKAMAGWAGNNVHFYASQLNENGEMVMPENMRASVGEKAPNGWYDHSTGDIYIDINAGNSGMGTGVYTLAHEYTHFIANNAAESFGKLAEFLQPEFEKQGKSFDELVQDQMAKAEAAGRSITEEVAREEVIADAMEGILSDTNAAERIAELKTKDMTLWQKLKELVGKMLNSVKKAYEGLNPDSQEGRMVLEMQDKLEDISKLFAEGFDEASRNYQQLDEDIVREMGTDAKVETTEKGETGQVVTEDGNIMLSERTYNDGGRDLFKKTMLKNGYTEAETQRALEYMDRAVNMLHKFAEDTGNQKLSDSLQTEIVADMKTGKAVLHTLTTNGDYPVNFDLSTICKKRVAYQRVLNRIVESGLISRVRLDGESIARINKILQGHGFETACAVCFVESRRTQVQAWAETFVEEWNREVDKVNPEAGYFGYSDQGREFVWDRDAFLKLEDELKSNRKNAKGNVTLPQSDSPTKVAALLKKVPSLAKKLTVQDILLPEALQRMRQDSGSANIYALIKQRYGAASPKITQYFAAYNGDAELLTSTYVKQLNGDPIKGFAKYKKMAQQELAKKGQEYGIKSAEVEKEALRLYLYDIGGARSQSFSDFIIENVFDKMQLYAGMAARRLPMHEYTKEIVGARIFGLTGAKINMSVIHHIDKSLGEAHAGLMRDSDGNYYYQADDFEHNMLTGDSQIQSIGYKDAVALQNDPRYAGNVGTIAIGFSDHHIEMMLEDNNIRMVIPYHKSGLPHIFAEIAGVDAARDYTDYQSTTPLEFFDLDGNPVDKSELGECKVDTSFNFNEAVNRLGDARAAAQEYLEWCKEKHPVYSKDKGAKKLGYATFKPKFSGGQTAERVYKDFTGHQNYYKLLEDFNCYDAITEEAAMQGDVTLTYPGMTELTEEQLEEYRQRLQDTGLFTPKEIDKYVAKARMGLEEIIQRELKARQQFNETQDEKFDDTIAEITEMLETEFPQTVEEREALRDKEREKKEGKKAGKKGVSLSARNNDEAVRAGWAEVKKESWRILDEYGVEKEKQGITMGTVMNSIWGRFGEKTVTQKQAEAALDEMLKNGAKLEQEAGESYEEAYQRKRNELQAEMQEIRDKYKEDPKTEKTETTLDKELAAGEKAIRERGEYSSKFGGKNLTIKLNRNGPGWWVVTAIADGKPREMPFQGSREDAAAYAARYGLYLGATEEEQKGLREYMREAEKKEDWNRKIEDATRKLFDMPETEEENTDEVVSLHSDIEDRKGNYAAAEYDAIDKGYPVVTDKDGNRHQAVPEWTFVKDRKIGNYGVIVGMDKQGNLVVAFENKTEGTKKNVTMPPEQAEYVDAKYQDLNEEQKRAALEEDIPEEKEVYAEEESPFEPNEYANSVEGYLDEEETSPFTTKRESTGENDVRVEYDRPEDLKKALEDRKEARIKTEDGIYEAKIRAKGKRQEATVYFNGKTIYKGKRDTVEDAAKMIELQIRNHMENTENADLDIETEKGPTIEMPGRAETVEAKKAEAKRAKTNVLKARARTLKAEIAAMERQSKKAGGQLTEAQERNLDDTRETLKITQEEIEHRKSSRSRGKRGKAAGNNMPTQTAAETKNRIMRDFFTANGNKADTGKVLDKALTVMWQDGKIDSNSMTELFRTLMDAGEVIVTPDAAKAKVRESLKGQRVYVSEELRKAMGEDYDKIRKAAMGLGFYLTGNKSDQSIAQMNGKLADTFGAEMFSSTTEREMLENMVLLSKEGRNRRMPLAERLEAEAKEDGRKLDEVFQEKYNQLAAALQQFGETAGIEVDIKNASAAKIAEERERWKKRMETQAQNRRENEIRKKTMAGLQRLNKMRNKAAPDTQKIIDEVLRDIDIHARQITPGGIENLQALAAEYDAMKEAAGFVDDENPGNFISSPYVEERLRNLEKRHINEMTLDEVIDLGRTVAAIEKCINDSKKMLGEAWERDVRQTAEDADAEIKDAPGMGKGFIQKWFAEEHLSPRRFLELMGGWKKDGTMAKLADSLEKAQTRAIDFQRRASQFFNPFLDRKETRKWLKTAMGKKAEWTEYEVLTEVQGNNLVGEKIKITPMMRVSLYMHSLNEDNLLHIQKGGIVIPDAELYKKGKIAEAYAAGTRVKIQPQSVRSIANELTTIEKEFAGYLERFMNGESKSAINEVSLQLDGFERAGVGKYWPIESSHNYLKSDVAAEAKAGTVEGIGSIANERKHGVNPIVLTDAYDVLEKQIDKVSRYYGYAIPIRNFQAVYNHVFHEEGNAFKGSIKETIGAKWGEGAHGYIAKMLQDLQGGGKKGDAMTSAFGKLRGNLASATLSANPAVALSQVASLPSAAPAVGWSGIVHSFGKKVDTKLVEKYSPLYWYRHTRGASNQELGDYIGEQTLEAKAPWLMGWINAMDGWAIRRLWAAAEYKVANETDLRPGSKADIMNGEDAYYKAVAEVFNRAVYDTQPNYSNMERAQILRSDSTLTNFLTMYKTVPLQYYGMTVEAAGKLQAAERAYKADPSQMNKEALKEARKFNANTVIGIATANIVYCAIKAAFKHLRGKDDDYKDEEGKITAKSAGIQLAKDMAEVYAGSVIFGSELLAAASYVATGGQYNAPEVTAVAYVEDVARAGRDIVEAAECGDPRETAGYIKDAAIRISQGFGIPTKNVESYLMAMVGLVSPEAKMAYDNAFGAFKKADLDEKTVAAGTGMLLENRLGTVSQDTSEEIARLYSAGNAGVIPGTVPTTFEYTNGEGEKVKVNIRRGKFREAWAEAVGDSLEELMATDEYEAASDELKAKLIQRIYDYATAQARKAQDEGYDVLNDSGLKWTARADSWMESGLSLAEAVIAMTKESGEANEYNPNLTKSDLDDTQNTGTLVAGVGAIMDERTAGVSQTSTEEIASLYEQGFTAAVPSNVPSSFTYTRDDVTTETAVEDKEAYAATWKSTVGGSVDELIGSKAYAAMDGKQRAACIDMLYDYATDKARLGADENYTQTTQSGKLDQLTESGLSLAQAAYMLYGMGQISGDKDADGKTISGSKKANVIAYIDALNITDEQKDLLFQLAGYKGSNKWGTGSSSGSSGSGGGGSGAVTVKDIGLPKNATGSGKSAAESMLEDLFQTSSTGPAAIYNSVANLFSGEYTAANTKAVTTTNKKETALERYKRTGKL